MRHKFNKVVTGVHDFNDDFDSDRERQVVFEVSRTMMISILIASVRPDRM